MSENQGAPQANPQNTAPQQNQPKPPTAAPTDPVVADNGVAPAKPAPAAPAVAVKQATIPKVTVRALISCAPVIGHLRLNLLKDKKYSVDAWVAPVLEEGKMAVRLETA